MAHLIWWYMLLHLAPSDMVIHIITWKFVFCKGLYYCCSLLHVPCTFLLPFLPGPMVSLPKKINLSFVFHDCSGGVPLIQKYEMLQNLKLFEHFDATYLMCDKYSQNLVFQVNCCTTSPSAYSIKGWNIRLIDFLLRQGPTAETTHAYKNMLKAEERQIWNTSVSN